MRIIALALVITGFAEAQDTIPKIKSNVRAQLDSMLNVTCLETIQRRSRSTARNANYKWIDTVGLDVLYTREKEMYAFPGDRKFATDDPVELAGAGLNQSGVFGSFLHIIFLEPGTTFQFKRETKEGARSFAEYDFTVPRTANPMKIFSDGSSGSAEMRGTFWVDARTLELIRMEVRAAEISPKLRLDAVTALIEYRDVRIGTREIRLPESAQFRLQSRSGSEKINAIAFSHCRTFGATSTLVDDPESGRAIHAPPQDVKLKDVPAGLAVAIELVTPITRELAVGSPIMGRVRSDVRKNGKRVIPAGSRVAGRIRTLAAMGGDGLSEYTLVGLEFTEIDVGATKLRFLARLMSIDPRALTEAVWTRGSRRVTEIEPPEIPGVGLFSIRGRAVNLPAGFWMNWKTFAP